MIIAALDFEATGLINPDIPPEYQPAIMEIGAVKIEIDPKGKEILRHEYQTFVDPERPIPDEVREITKITDKVLVGAPTFKVAHSKFALFMTGVDRLVTFNGPGYDLPVLDFNLQRVGLRYNFPWPRLHTDLMTAASDYCGMTGKTGNKPPKLMELYTFLFKKEFPDAHRALEDARATIKCALELNKKGIIRLLSGS